jgi:hypothetical protein
VAYRDWLSPIFMASIYFTTHMKTIYKNKVCPYDCYLPFYHMLMSICNPINVFEILKGVVEHVCAEL